MSAQSPVRRPAKPRHRPSEAFTPRASDYVAARIRPLATWMIRTGTSVEIDGVRYDGESLMRLAESQATDERKLESVFESFRQEWVAHGAQTRSREGTLMRIVGALPRPADREGRDALRYARLLRPPIAVARRAAPVAG